MRQSPAPDLVAGSLFLQAVILFGTAIRMLSFLKEDSRYLIHSFILSFLSTLFVFLGIGLLRRRLYAWVLSIGFQFIVFGCALFGIYLTEILRIPAAFLSGLTLLLFPFSKEELS